MEFVWYRCLEEGAEDFIVKPVKLADVKRLKDYMMREVRFETDNNINKRKSCCDLTSSEQFPIVSAYVSASHLEYALNDALDQCSLGWFDLILGLIWFG